MLAFCLLPPVWGYEKDRAVANLAHDYANCAAYYTFVSQSSPLKEHNPAVSLKYMEVAGFMLQLSTELSNQKVSDARYTSAIDGMYNQIQNIWSNMSILHYQYETTCKLLLETPEERLRHWLNKVD
jgi:hypothetical protein